ncbi:HAD-IA family hydrolase [Candidatus Woesearchaeota archaeon]|nr:HAD-IA family hydrolase [Candidatus Woesearchaeota archaeon]
MRLICFDLDGTLIYSDKVHLTAIHATLKKYRLKDHSNEEFLKLFGLPLHIILERLGYPKKIIPTIVEEHRTLVVKKTHKYAKAFPGVKNALIKLKKHYNLALLSNSSHREVMALLKGAKIDFKLFDVIIGGDEVHDGKPNPEEIKKAEKILHLKADYMVGDTIYDIKAGKRARARPIGVLTGTVHGQKELKKQRPWRIIKSAANLPELLI